MSSGSTPILPAPVPAAAVRPGTLRHARRAGAVAVLAVLFVPEQPGNPANVFATTAPPAPVAAAPAGSVQGTEAAATDEAADLVPAPPFAAAYGDAASAMRAETCLTEAIYYEGATESERGQRAIAQVVLNRVRHPAYPDNVCGVVFEGQHLPTGCQFTFTCDGSRARRPVPYLWERAKLVAKAALGGMVAEDVGLATHYHADYVAPYWAPSLDPAGQVGRHVFYRWRGSAGRPEAFSTRYSGREPLIAAYSPRGQSAQAQVQPGATDETALPLPEPERIAEVAAPPARVPFTARPLRMAGNEAPKP